MFQGPLEGEDEVRIVGEDVTRLGIHICIIFCIIFQ